MLWKEKKKDTNQEGKEANKPSLHCELLPLTHHPGYQQSMKYPNRKKKRYAQLCFLVL
jgi:hypothetical protein